jgi:transposase
LIVAAMSPLRVKGRLAGALSSAQWEGSAMMGRKDCAQRQLFYEFDLDDMVPEDHLLRRLDVFVTAALADLHEQLKSFYSDIGRPSLDPELMIRLLIIGYCYVLRSERRLCQEAALHLAYRWFCRLDLGDKVPHHSTFSVNRLGASARAISCATSSSGWCRPAWRLASSKAMALRSMRA